MNFSSLVEQPSLACYVKEVAIGLGLIVITFSFFDKALEELQAPSFWL
jgi:hypothetical protein